MIIITIDLEHTEAGLTLESNCQRLQEMVLIKNVTQLVVFVSSKVQWR
jgi:hypothetical protein